MNSPETLLLGPPVHQEKASLAQAELAQIVAHKLFRKSQVLQRLLAFLIDAELRHRPVTESLLATAVFGLKDDEFHPYTNSNVRVNTSLLRRRLTAYYQEIAPTRIRLHFPQGSLRLRIDVLDPDQELWRRAFGQAKLLATSWYGDELELALRRIEEVLAEQPNFGPAFALRSQLHLTIGSHGAPPLDHMAPAREAAKRAMALAPDAWESLTAAGNVAALLDWDWPQAERLYERAGTVAGNEVVGDPWYQAAQVALDRIEPCLAKMRQALIDYPMPPRTLQKVYGAMLSLAGRWEEAEREMRQTTEIYPDDFVAWMWLAMQAITLGNRGQATQCLVRSVAVTRGRLPGALIAMMRDFLLTGKLPSAQSAPGSAAEVAKVLIGAVMKRADLATDALERMVENRNVLAVVYLRGPMQSHLHDSPKFLALFDRMGIPRPVRA